MANVLAQKTFDALPEFLNTIYVLLLHPPCAIRRVGRSRLERFDLFLHPKIPRDICHQIFNKWKGLHGFDRDRSFQWQFAEARHAHQLRHPVHFRRARPAFACLAVPSAGEIGRLRPLDVVHGVEHDHAFGHIGGVIAKLAASGIATPDFENCCFQKVERLNG